MSLIGFPREVNEKAARTVAAGVVLLAGVALLTGWTAVPALMAIGFALRVAAGPRFSPLGRLSAQVIAPRLGDPVPTAGAPKRFAQAIGLAFTLGATIAWFAGAHTVGVVLLSVLLVFATLESVLGFCAGCYVFGYLMRWGVIPDDVCEACNNIALRREPAV